MSNSTDSSPHLWRNYNDFRTSAIPRNTRGQKDRRRHHVPHMGEDIYTSLDQDLLISGIILHDIGKIQELSGPIAPVYTLEGNLLGHISIGAELVKRKADELGFKGEKVTLLIHMILSHHGAKEYGSPVLPMIKEAEILSLIDNIDARMNMFEKALAETEEGEYTKRIFALENRNIYKPKKA